MTLGDRTHYCGDVTAELVGSEVLLKGWVRRRRDLGSLVFVDLRDREGIVQLTFSQDSRPDLFALAKTLRPEFVIEAAGKVRRRSDRDVNPQMKTGEVEVDAERLEILSESETPPFAVEDAVAVSEELRLQYRYLDLRRPVQNSRIIARHKLAMRARRCLSEKGFVEIETPFLTRSTPEGARDFLVPSRMRPGDFYALPQSPQLFKQLSMVAGFDKYFQVARCFRDEDLRADRQPEFTQIDVEMSFPTEDGVMRLAEDLVDDLFEEAGRQRHGEVPRLTYDQAMERYGTDKPDTRFGLELKTVSDIASKTSFRVFRSVLESGGSVRGLCVPGKAGLSRKDLDALNDVVKPFGGKGVVSLSRRDGTAAGAVVKHLGESYAAALLDAVGAGEGDLGLFVAASYETACACLSALRLHFARQLELTGQKRLDLVWVNRFPAFEWDEDDNRWVARHHPFTMPRPEQWGWLESDPGKVEAMAYDLVLNGNEIAGGSIRIHRRDVQERVFAALGFTREAAREKFGFLLDAFRYGTPPHGGIAFGFDRLVMLLLGCESIRDVIPFPKTTSGLCLMTGSPAQVDRKQLEDLHLRVEPRKREAAEGASSVSGEVENDKGDTGR
ncbi:MAG: aspartate--tRNA ligase [Acidobacteriota bacterium]|jgi:aspartyl-tRNA synthetase